MQAQLIPLDGGEPISLQNTVTIVGRDGAVCDVRLESERVSKRHCLIEIRDGTLTIRDLGSMNGLRVNRQRVAQAALRPGDELAIADMSFWIRIDADAAHTTGDSSPQSASQPLGQTLSLPRGFPDLPDLPEDDDSPQGPEGPGGEWYMRVLGFELGPLTFDALGQAVQEGKLTPLDDIKCGADGEWVLARTVPELFQGKAAAPSSRAARPPASSTPPSWAAPSRSARERPAANRAASDASSSTRSAAFSRERAARSQSSLAKAGVESSAQPAAPASAGVAGEQYFCWADGREQGPFSVARLAARAADGRMAREEFVKSAHTGTWLPAASIPGVFTDTGNDADADAEESRFAADADRPPDTSIFMGDQSTDVSIADVVASVPSNMPLRAVPAPRPVPPPVPLTALSVPQPPSPAAAPRWPSAGFPTIESSPARSAPAAKHPPRVRRWEDEEPQFETAGERVTRYIKRNPKQCAAIAGVVAALALLLTVMFLSSSPSDRKVLEAYTAIWDELKEKRSQRVHSSEWIAFTTRAKEEIDPMIALLKKTANNRERAKQELLWASEYLPFMLVDARIQPSESEEKFARHLLEAERILSGGQAGPNLPPPELRADATEDDPEARPMSVLH